MCILCRIVCLVPGPSYWFTKSLPKRVRGYAGTHIVLACETNSCQAPVKWYFRDVGGAGSRIEVKSGDSRLVVTEDMTSDEPARKVLTLVTAGRQDSGTFECRIVSPAGAGPGVSKAGKMSAADAAKVQVTKCAVKIVPVTGRLGHVNLILEKES